MTLRIAARVMRIMCASTTRVSAVAGRTTASSRCRKGVVSSTVEIDGKICQCTANRKIST